MKLSIDGIRESHFFFASRSQYAGRLFGSSLTHPTNGRPTKPDRLSDRNLRSLMPRLWLNRRMGHAGERLRVERKGLMTEGVYQEGEEYQVCKWGSKNRERKKKGFSSLRYDRENT